MGIPIFKETVIPMRIMWHRINKTNKCSASKVSLFLSFDLLTFQLM